MSHSVLEFFVYDHAERTFNYFDGDRGRLEEVMAADNPDQIADELDEEGIDGLLVLDESGGRWYLAFSSSLGIVGQRTARRQADSVVRSGYTLPDGYWLKANYPLEELSDPNIGDLWQTVQQKYVKDGSLTGLELDEESGIPRQLAERAKEMEKAGVSDDLAEAKLEKQEAEERAKAVAKSSAPRKKPKKKAKADKPKKKEKKEVKKAEPKKAAKKDKAEAGDGPHFIEIDELAEYVHNDFTRIVAKGTLTDSKGNSKSANIIFDQARIPKTSWNDIVIFLEEEDVLEITLEETEDEIFALTAKV